MPLHPLPLALAVALAACARATFPYSTIAGVPEAVGGPTCCMFDTPFLGLRVGAATTAAYTGNSASYVWSYGASVNAMLEPPAPTGLVADPDPNAYSHCGKWLNAAYFADDRCAACCALY